MDFCPNTRILLIGCKTDLRTDVCTLMELSNQKQTPVTYEQVRPREVPSGESSSSRCGYSDVKRQNYTCTLTYDLWEGSRFSIV